MLSSESSFHWNSAKTEENDNPLSLEKKPKSKVSFFFL